MMEKQPNPGSPEAVEAGCICPQEDNAFGEGLLGLGVVFWMNKECPLHGERAFIFGILQTKNDEENLIN